MDLTQYNRCDQLFLPFGIRDSIYLSKKVERKIRLLEWQAAVLHFCNLRFAPTLEDLEHLQSMPGSSPVCEVLFATYMGNETNREFTLKRIPDEKAIVCALPGELS